MQLIFMNGQTVIAQIDVQSETLYNQQDIVFHNGLAYRVSETNKEITTFDIAHLLVVDLPQVAVEDKDGN